MLKILVAVLLGAAIALAVIAAKNRHRFRYQPTQLAAADFAQLAARPGFVADEFEVEPGVTLRGLVRQPTGKPGAWLLFLPGNGGDVLRGAQSLLERLAAGSGLGLAVWAYRGFDGSLGTPSAAAFAADSEKVYARLQTKHGAEPQRIHLVSFSLGTALNLRLAGLATARGTPPASLVLLSAYDQIQVTQDAWWAPWSFADVYDAVEQTRDSRVDTLLVHGTLDDAVPVAAARTLAAALGPRARLIELPGRGHVDWLEDEAALTQIREFIVRLTPP